MRGPEPACGSARRGVPPLSAPPAERHVDGEAGPPRGHDGSRPLPVRFCGLWREDSGMSRGSGAFGCRRGLRVPSGPPGQCGLLRW